MDPGRAILCSPRHEFVGRLVVIGMSRRCVRERPPVAPESYTAWQGYRPVLSLAGGRSAVDLK
ncbi:hypothetical protein GCM10010434_021310 [Winogradskya humida]